MRDKLILSIQRVKRVLSNNLNTWERARLVLGAKIYLPVLFGFVGIFFQAGAISILYSFLKLQDLPPQTAFLIDPASLTFQTKALMVSCFVFLSLLLSALANYWYQKVSISMASEVEREALYALITKAQATPLFNVEKIEGISDRSMFSRHLFADTKALNRALQMALTSVVPVVSFLFAAGVVVYLNWAISLALVPMFMLYMIAIYKVNEQSISSSHNYDKKTSQVKQEVLEKAVRPGSNHVVDEQNFEDYFSAYTNLVTVVHKSSLVNDVFVAVTLTLIFLGATQTYSEFSYSNLADIALYLIALRYAISFLKQFSAKYATLNRFYPQTSRLQRFRSRLKSFGSPKKDTMPKISFEEGVEISRVKSFLIDTDQTFGRFSVLGKINQMVGEKNENTYRDILLLARDILPKDITDEELFEEYEAFKVIVKEKDISWILIDRWFFKRLKLSMGQLDQDFSQSFCGVAKEVEPADVSESRVVVSFREDAMVGAVVAKESSASSGASFDSQADDDDDTATMDI